ncbi:MAG: dienelactone hydrolase family protein [Nannocystaceae bacterium]|nr:dienelactone hydrolase family protein [Nannocystaceae bacterium]
MVEFGANGDRAAGYLSLPAAGTGPGLLVLQEWWGLVDHIKRVADRFAQAGFVALAPDLYDGESTTSPDDAGRRLMALDIARTAKKLAGAADYLLAHARVAPKKVAALGFCMGGQLALFGGCEHPDRICAVVDFYGVHPKVELRPERLSGPVLAHFGERDEFVPPATANGLVATLQSAGARVQAHHYAAGHAFFNDARPEAYDAPAAAQAWDRTLAFLRTALA